MSFRDSVIRLNEWVDPLYKFIMLVAMVVEIGLLVVIVWQGFQK